MLALAHDGHQIKQLVPVVIQNLASNDFVVKKLALFFISTFASHADLLLAVNVLVKVLLNF